MYPEMEIEHATMGTSVTQIGNPALSRLKSTWSMPDLLSHDLTDSAAGPFPDVFTGTAGARLCERYVDGELQLNEALWPWPMNARIKRATRAEENIDLGYDPDNGYYVNKNIKKALNGGAAIPAPCWSK